MNADNPAGSMELEYLFVVVYSTKRDAGFNYRNHWLKSMQHQKLVFNGHKNTHAQILTQIVTLIFI